MAKKIFFYVLIRSRKAFGNFDKCINSVFFQDNTNYKILYSDDASGYTKKQKKYIKEKLKKHIVLFNKSRKYSLRNAYDIIHKYSTVYGAIVFNLDGDDWLPHTNCLSEVGNS